MVEVILEMVNSRGVHVTDPVTIKLPVLPSVGHRLSYRSFTGDVSKVFWEVAGPLDTEITVTVLVC